MSKLSAEQEGPRLTTGTTVYAIGPEGPTVVMWTTDLLNASESVERAQTPRGRHADRTRLSVRAGLHALALANSLMPEREAAPNTDDAVLHVSPNPSWTVPEEERIGLDVS